jgi:hypothetical protein|tara:strand:- start:377 stop:505 length:129 start_codon:yes stop_codon:yes gene_type:complete
MECALHRLISLRQPHIVFSFENRENIMVEPNLIIDERGVEYG